MVCALLRARTSVSATHPTTKVTHKSTQVVTPSDVSNCSRSAMLSVCDVYSAEKKVRRTVLQLSSRSTCAGGWNVVVTARRAYEERVPVKAAAAAEVGSPTRNPVGCMVGCCHSVDFLTWQAAGHRRRC